MGMWRLLLPVTACRQDKLLRHMRVILKVNWDMRRVRKVKIHHV